jgi:hypothetical protein
MFNLESGIAEWRRQMLAAGIKTPMPLEELEGHLREDIERQMASGTDAQTAFALAVQAIGQPGALKSEFLKTGGAQTESRKTERWVVFFSLCALILFDIGTLLKFEMSWGWRLFGFADMALITLSLGAWPYIDRIFPVIPNHRTRTTVGVSLGIFGMAATVIFMNFILPHFNLTEGQLRIVVFWTLTHMGAWGVVLTGLEEAARRRGV